MDINFRIQTFIALGEFFSTFPGDHPLDPDHILEESVSKASFVNPWFTRENIVYAIHALGQAMSGNKIEKWISPYPDFKERVSQAVKTIGVITAGNIPLAGFHDFISVLISGNRFLGKLSAQDNILLPAVAAIMKRMDNDWESRIFFTGEALGSFDALIATGSNNTFRYFQYYFGKYPHLLRKNRNGIAVLSGNETDRELEGLASDVMMYFGLGCRSVSKIFIPDHFDPGFLEAIFRPYSAYLKHNKYHNNYDYQKSILTVSGTSCTDFGHLLLVADQHVASPVAVLHYEKYNDIVNLKKQIQCLNDQIQCVVGRSGDGLQTVSHGESQHPELRDYADGRDTLEFLLNEI